MACHLVGTSHYLNHRWLIGNWLIGNKSRWNFNWNTNTDIQKNVFNDGVCKILGLNVLSVDGLIRQRWIRQLISPVCQQAGSCSNYDFCELDPQQLTYVIFKSICNYFNEFVNIVEKCNFLSGRPKFDKPTTIPAADSYRADICSSDDSSNVIWRLLQYEICDIDIHFEYMKMFAWSMFFNSFTFQSIKSK